MKTVIASAVALMILSVNVAAPAYASYCTDHWIKCMWQRIADQGKGR